MSSDDKIKYTYAPLRQQPFKLVYLLFQLANTLILVPYWAIVSVPPALRPRKSWSWARTMVVRVVRHMDVIQAQVGDFRKPHNHLALVNDKKYPGVWVDPIPQQFVVGKAEMWASAVGVKPVRLPGYWTHQPGSDISPGAPFNPGEKVVYALHGGAYTRFSAHPTEIPGHARHGMIRSVDSVHRTFAIEYRLSSTAPYTKAHPFPTALIDALTGYHYLVSTVRIPPKDIILMGDSAGGNLALALTRYLVEHPLPLLPPPGSLLLLSPWADMGTSHDTPSSSLTTCASTDFLAPPKVISGQSTFLHYSIRAYTGPFGLGAAETNPYISPASKHLDVGFEGFPRTFISGGEAEIFRDSLRTLYARMVRDMGEENVEYLEAADSVHDLLLLPGLQEPQLGETLGAIAEWVKKG
ncbi:Abhydrolase-3 domain-containing protein [Favolaschia claudopus]|uniref:Abhydrolase-3 domain-containing protein n=1 Tax=Favolaschia claudopus TaxID=2862362 RepID=A0AAW0BUX2_9AGAR